jgi:uncharacterized protein YaaQ
MKLIIAILRDVDNDPVSHALIEEKFRVTCIASTGGFLRRGQSTLLAGVEDDQVENALGIIRKTVTQPSEGDTHHSVLFVVNVNQFIQF